MRVAGRRQASDCEKQRQQQHPSNHLSLSSPFVSFLSPLSPLLDVWVGGGEKGHKEREKVEIEFQ